VVAGSLAIPLRQRAAGDVRLDREAGEELVDLDVVGQLLAVGDARGDRVLPAELRALDVQVVSDDQRACLIENPVIRSGALAHRQGWTEPVECTQAIQDIQASSRGSRAGEVQACDLARRQHTELKAVPGDPSVTLCQVRCEPRSTLARAEKDAEQMQVASTQRESRVQVRASDPETSKTSPWTFLDEGSSS